MSRMNMREDADRSGVTVDAEKSIARAHARTRKADPVLTSVKEWLLRRNTLDALVIRWQHLEHQLLLQTRPLGIDFEEAARRGFNEARAMRRLDKRIASLERGLNGAAGRI